jgi:hypothetical protein
MPRAGDDPGFSCVLFFYDRGDNMMMKEEIEFEINNMDTDPDGSINRVRRT